MKKLSIVRISTILFLILSLLFSASDGFAQLKSKLLLNFDYIAQSQLKDPIPGFPDSDQAEWEMFTGEAEFSFPLFAAYETRGRHKIPKRALINKLSYQRKVTQERLSGLSDDHFDGLNYTATYLQRLGGGPWYLNLIGGIGIAADDLGEVASDDAKIQAGILFDRTSAAGWTWGLGVIFSQFTGDNLVLPLIHLAKESDKTKFELLVPKISFEYKLGNQTTFGLVGELEGDLYTVTNSDVTLFDGQGNIVKENVGIELAFSEFKFGPQLKLSPQPNVTVAVHAGVSVARRFELLAKDEGKTLRFPPGSNGAGEKVDFDIKPNAFIKAVINFEF